MAYLDQCGIIENEGSEKTGLRRSSCRVVERGFFVYNILNFPVF